MNPPARIRAADDPAALDDAAALLAGGRLVGVPTETVYGLAADATNGEAVASIFAAKGRPRFNPLIAHVDGLDRAQTLIELGEAGVQLAEAFWPGPLTLVGRQMPASPVSDLATAGLDTLAVRHPRSEAMTRLISVLDRPLAAPSANPSGRLSPTTAEDVATGLGDKVRLILDAGACPVGVESTIVDISGDTPRLLRPGGVSVEAIERIVGPLDHADDGSVTAPGMLVSHYAPNATLRLNADAPQPGEAWLGFGPGLEPKVDISLNLSTQGFLEEAAARLFSALRELDSRSTRIAVAPIPETGLGLAINDRLKRAAAPR
ncbi:MAG: L-threonylcarbamoyladenylate synthase [Pseudomonadota bacterium]